MSLAVFDFDARNTNLSREVRGGATTFLTMTTSYIESASGVAEGARTGVH
jgi:xanthine/uracil/vitamin C permease (AzgA family)